MGVELEAFESCLVAMLLRMVSETLELDPALTIFVGADLEPMDEMKEFVGVEKEVISSACSKCRA